MTIAYLGSSVGVFSVLYLDMHRSFFQEIVAESAPSNSEKLLFSKEEFSKIKWIEKNREFEWRDKMYDVSKIETTEKGFRVYCVNDDLEESFINMIDHWKKSNSPFGKTKTIFQPQFCNDLNFGLTRSDVAWTYFSYPQQIYLSPGFTVTAHPPEPLL